MSLYHFDQFLCTYNHQSPIFEQYGMRNDECVYYTLNIVILTLYGAVVVVIVW